MSKTAIQQNDWREVKLGDVVTFQRGFDLPRKNRMPGEYPLMVSNGQDGTHCEYKVEGPGVVIGRSGTLGQVCFVNKNYWPLNTTLWVKDFHGNDVGFVYYFLKTLSLERYNAGSGVPTLNRNHIHQLPVSIPPIPQQKAVAEMLSSFDDKIDLLHRQNKTLEDMAQALFRNWFVEEADEGWNEKKLGDFFPIITGKKDANYSTYNGRYLFFTCAQGILRAPDYSFEGKAILLAGNGDFNVKRYEGKFEAYQRTYVLIPYEEKYFGFLYILIKFYLGQITGGAQGSVIRFITKGMISDFTFLLPNTNIDDKLEQMNQIYLKVDSNRFQIYTLENLRNTLLPKLMSGAARVRLDL